MRAFNSPVDPAQAQNRRCMQMGTAIEHDFGFTTRTYVEVQTKDKLEESKHFFQYFKFYKSIFFIRKYHCYVTLFLVLHRKSFVDKKKSAEQVKRGEKRRKSLENLILQLDLSWGKF